MTRTWPNLFLVLLLKLTLVATGSAAEPKPATGQEWEIFVKKAEEEGEVAIYATDSIGHAQTIWAAFQKRYPKIKLLGTSVGRGSDLFPKLFSERRAGKLKGDEATLFSGEFWTGKRGLELGLVDGMGELRATLQARYGAKVHLPVIGPRRRLLSRFGLGTSAGGTGIDGIGPATLAAIEERLHWQRFGL